MKTNHRRKVKKKAKGEKGCGYEYWGKRDAKMAGPVPGASNKRLTSRRERRKGKMLEVPSPEEASQAIAEEQVYVETQMHEDGNCPCGHGPKEKCTKGYGDDCKCSACNPVDEEAKEKVRQANQRASSWLSDKDIEILMTKYAGERDKFDAAMREDESRGKRWSSHMVIRAILAIAYKKHGVATISAKMPVLHGFVFDLSIKPEFARLLGGFEFDQRGTFPYSQGLENQFAALQIAGHMAAIQDELAILPKMWICFQKHDQGSFSENELRIIDGMAQELACSSARGKLKLGAGGENADSGK